MVSILTVTFSPCIDKSSTTPFLLPVKKLRCTHPRIEPGGGGINVAKAITRLGGNVLAVYPAGGYTGKALNNLMKSQGIPTHFVETGVETRENVVILETSNNNQYRFVMPAVSLLQTEWEALIRAIEKMAASGFIVISGSMPENSPGDLFDRVTRIASAANAKLVVDTSGRSLEQALSAGVYMIKPNLSELAKLVNRASIDMTEAGREAQRLVHAGHCEIVLVSLGDKGAILVTGDTIKRIPAPDVTSQSTVGAGDSMVAGMVLSLSTGRTPEEAATYAVACGTAATLRPGTELCRKEDVEELLQRMTR